MAARLLPLQLSLSLHSIAHTHVLSQPSLCSQIIASFIGKHGELSPAIARGQ